MQIMTNCIHTINCQFWYGMVFMMAYYLVEFLAQPILLSKTNVIFPQV